MIAQNKLYGLLGLCSKAGKLTFGTEATEEAILKRIVYFIIIADDSSEKTKNKFKTICEKRKIDYIVYGTIDDNSKAIGKSNKAILGVKDKNLANAIKKIIYGGDTIG
mgnify:CR=1 FL=1